MEFTKTKKITSEAGKNIAEETIDVAKLNIGKIIYSNAKAVLAPYMPKLRWYEKLVLSKDKKEMGELIAIYGALHVLKTKYDHYLIDAVTMYINMQLQTKLIGSINISDLDNIFKLPTKQD